MICPECGRKLQDGTKFCGGGGCGHDLGKGKNERWSRAKEWMICGAVMACCVAVSVLIGSCKFRPPESKSEWTFYVADDGHTYITGYTGRESEVVIPSVVMMKSTHGSFGYVVDVIGCYAFYDNSSLKSVEIPDSVEEIDKHAFSGCRSLTSIKLPDSVKVIDEGAFSVCSNLTSIEIPDGVEMIGGGAFSGCRSLTSINIPDSVTYIGDWAFSDCSSLTSIVIPDSVTYIGRNAFSDCENLTSVRVPDGFEYIEGGDVWPTRK